MARGQVNARATISSPEAAETNITDETYAVGNGEFLRAVLGDEVTDARPVLVSFEGNPASVPAKVWFGRPWHGKPDASTSKNSSYIAPRTAKALYQSRRHRIMIG